jgi:hypothetical protein
VGPNLVVKINIHPTRGKKIPPKTSRLHKEWRVKLLSPNVPTEPPSSIEMQRVQGIDTGGATSGNVACE